MRSVLDIESLVTRDVQVALRGKADNSMSYYSTIAPNYADHVDNNRMRIQWQLDRTRCTRSMVQLALSIVHGHVEYSR